MSGRCNMDRGPSIIIPTLESLDDGGQNEKRRLKKIITAIQGLERQWDDIKYYLSSQKDPSFGEVFRILDRAYECKRGILDFKSMHEEPRRYVEIVIEFISQLYKIKGIFLTIVLVKIRSADNERTTTDSMIDDNSSINVAREIAVSQIKNIDMIVMFLCKELYLYYIRKVLPERIMRLKKKIKKVIDNISLDDNLNSGVIETLLTSEALSNDIITRQLDKIKETKEACRMLCCLINIIEGEERKER